MLSLNIDVRCMNFACVICHPSHAIYCDDVTTTILVSFAIEDFSKMMRTDGNDGYSNSHKQKQVVQQMSFIVRSCSWSGHALENSSTLRGHDTQCISLMSHLSTRREHMLPPFTRFPPHQA